MRADIDCEDSGTVDIKDYAQVSFNGSRENISAGTGGQNMNFVSSEPGVEWVVAENSPSFLR